ncbi:MAG: hypothetical protein GY810_23700 [Aureispira sp.]|nr:hypothetical protein [Aureispira sp.]
MGAIFFLIILSIGLMLCSPPPLHLSHKSLKAFKKLGRIIGFGQEELSKLDLKIDDWTTVEGSLSGDINGRNLKIKIKELNSVTYPLWDIEIIWTCQNPYGVSLQMYPETAITEIQKKFGMQDIEIFQEELDEAYIIKCNHRQFLLQNFSPEFGERLLTKESATGSIQLKGNQIHYSDIIPLHIEGAIDYINVLVQTNRFLAEMVDNWQPLYKINQAA